MTKTARARYTLEFKQEVVRLVESGQSIAAATRTLRVVDQMLFNWVKAQCRADGNQSTAGRTGACEDGADILKKATVYFAKGSI